MNDTIQINFSGLSSAKLSEEQFSDNIENSLKKILAVQFPNDLVKQRVKKTVLGYNFACPCCGDSHIDSKKKRAHILLKGKFAGRFTCFNCGAKMSMQQFFDKFDSALSSSEIEFINDNIAPESTSYNPGKMASAVSSQVINKAEAYEWAVSREFIKQCLMLQEIDAGVSPDAYYYLINRCQYNNYERFLYNPYMHQIYLLNLVDDRVIGLQIRSIDPNYAGPKYLTMNIEKIRSVFLNDNSPVPESVSKLSCVFNIFNVNFIGQMPVLVTEGPFDAFLLPNCIAVAGASKQFDMQFPFWYVYDDDDTGRAHAVEMLNRGYKVFMWQKFKSDYNLPQKNPYGKPGSNLKWDVTDVMKFLRDVPQGKQLYWSPYFTSDSLDGFYI